MTTNALLLTSELPRDPDGAVLGMYFARTPSGEDTLEVGEEPFESGGVVRLDAALGNGVRWLPADRATAQDCARHLYESSGDGDRAKALRRLYPAPRQPRKRPAKKTKKKATER